MKKILSLLLISGLFISFSGCGDDDNAAPSMTLNLDGTNIKVGTVSGIMVFDTESGHESRSLNITGVTKDENFINVQIANWDFQNPPTNGFIKKKYYNPFDTEEGMEASECLETDGATLCDAGIITYTVLSDGEIYTSAFTEESDGYIEVTSSKGKKISGTFDVIITSVDQEVEMRATGTFKNISYRIQ